MSVNVAELGREAVLHGLRNRGLAAWTADGRISAVMTRTTSGQLVHIRVSTRTAGTWQTNKKWRSGTAKHDPARLWAFVTITKDSQATGADVVFAAEAAVLREIDDEVQSWFERNLLTDPSVKEKGHCKITLERVQRIKQSLDTLLQ